MRAPITTPALEAALAAYREASARLRHKPVVRQGMATDDRRSGTGSNVGTELKSGWPHAEPREERGNDD